MTGKTIPIRLLLTASAMCAGVAPGETITLQQGARGYAGCTTKPAQLRLRGAKNKFEIRFELPKDIPAEKLARARLCLFLPEARKANMFTEIFCHEIVQVEPGRCARTVSRHDRRPRRRHHADRAGPAGEGLAVRDPAEVELPHVGQVRRGPHRPSDRPSPSYAARSTRPRLRGPEGQTPVGREVERPLAQANVF